MSRRVLVVHGPNLNLLGEREPDVYGRATLGEIDAALKEHGQELGLEVRTMQSNIEGELVEAIQRARHDADAVLINAAGYSHTSVAIRDAVAAVSAPAIAVHLSNPHAREDFRHTDLVAGACVGVVSGFGANSYLLALEAAHRLLTRTDRE